MTQALHGAAGTDAQTLGLIIDTFGIAPSDELTDLYLRLTEAFREAERWERTGVL